MATIYVAEYDSRNFAFLAVGETLEEARAALLAGLDRHGEQYDCVPGWYWDDGMGYASADDWVREEVYVAAVPAGACLRDREVIR